jgi:hypothetical protein
MRKTDDRVTKSAVPLAFRYAVMGTKISQSEELHLPTLSGVVTGRFRSPYRSP